MKKKKEKERRAAEQQALVDEENARRKARGRAYMPGGNRTQTLNKGGLSASKQSSETSPGLSPQSKGPFRTGPRGRESLDSQGNEMSALNAKQYDKKLDFPSGKSSPEMDPHSLANRQKTNVPRSGSQ